MGWFKVNFGNFRGQGQSRAGKGSSLLRDKFPLNQRPIRHHIRNVLRWGLCSIVLFLIGFLVAITIQKASIPGVRPVPTIPPVGYGRNIPVYSAGPEMKPLAAYTPKDSKITIAMGLVHTHALLAEYARFAILVENGKEISRRRLFEDTGGYTSSNLYRCGPDKYMLKGHFDTWVLDLKAQAITEGACRSTNPNYVGVFDGGGSKPWKFYPASERKEMKLEPKK
jgi:hypothetical protein